MEELTIFDDVSEKKIYKPKVRRLIPHKRHNKPKTSSNNTIYTKYWNNSDEENSVLYLDNISLEEMKNDFMKLNENLEEECFYNEIMNIMSFSNATQKREIYSKKNIINSKKKKKSKQSQNINK